MTTLENLLLSNCSKQFSSVLPKREMELSSHR